MTTYQHLLARCESAAYAPLWRACYPRAYRDAGAWHSPRVPAVVSVSAIQAAMLLPPGRLHGSPMIHYLAAAALDVHDVPTYFASRSLLESVSRTDPPPGTRWAALPLPHPGILYVLPRGAVVDPEGREVAYIALARIDPGQQIAHRAAGLPPMALSESTLIVTAASPDGDLPMYDAALSAGTTPTLDGIGDLTSGSDIRLREDGALDWESRPISAEDATFTAGLLGLAVRLWLVMLARPQLVEAGRRTGRPKKPGAPEYWSPTILGGTYRIAHDRGAASSPGDGPGRHVRIHWRRGHMRHQPYGPGRSQHRLIWIEPALVGGRSSTSGTP